MKSSLSNILNKTPWWALILGAVTTMVGLAFFVTPYHIIQYRQFDDPEHSRAIKREIDNTFAEQAINLARNVVRGMRDATRDEERRAELDTALEGLEEARRELREAGSEVVRQKRDALEQMNEAARRATEAVREARREAERALKGGGIDNPDTRRHLEESMRAAEEAEKETKRALKENARETARQAKEAATLDKEVAKIDKEKAKLDKEKAKLEAGKAKLAEKEKLAADKAGGLTVDLGLSDKGRGPMIRIDPPDINPPPDLPPELREKIQRNVVGDMYRIGIGAVLVMILLPMFILAVIAKFFIDRSRAAQRQAELKRKEADYHRLTQQVTEAKLAALQAQVEPHFLYNTLASVQALTEVDPAQASAMTGHLIQYLRNALPKMRESVSTVGQEIELVRAFLNILQMRMGKRLTFDINVPVELEALSFPPLMLPSLVENAIKHGLEPQREGGNVRITAERVEGKLRLIVADTGKGFGETIGNGVGLTNIRERLAALYGNAASLTMEANEPQGVVATLEVPTDGTRAPAPPAPSPEEIAAGASPAAAAASPAAATMEVAESAKPKTTTQKVLAVLATMERGWRKGLSYLFIALAVVAVVVAFVAFIAMLFGELPVEIGNEAITGPGGALVGTLGILVGLIAMVLALAICTVVVYGLGFLLVGLAIFIPLVFLVGISPVLAPFILLGLFIWWLVKKNRKEPVPATPK